MKLSILICTVDGREQFLERLESVLNPQIQFLKDYIEVHILKDDGFLTIGTKRNMLLEKATGEYIVFIDDDDLISHDYISKIFDAMESKPDVIGMHLLHFNDGNLAGFTYHSLRYNKWHEDRDSVTGLMRYYRNPNHLNPVKRELALSIGFKDISMGEDKDYSERLLGLIRTEEYIYEPIYYYFFRSNKNG
jgi:poly(ribitol-phosphate) beta-N-acetylglucosaminyltransferase